MATNEKKGPEDLSDYLLVMGDVMRSFNEGAKDILQSPNKPKLKKTAAAMLAVDAAFGQLASVPSEHAYNFREFLLDPEHMANALRRLADWVEKKPVDFPPEG